VTRRHQARTRAASLEPQGQGHDDEVGSVAGRAQEGDVVVVSLALRLEACRSGARLVTARHLRRTGALEIHPDAEGLSNIFSAAQVTPAVENLDRPWARHRSYDWRTGSFDPQGDQ
jgi:competence protein ComEC